MLATALQADAMVCFEGGGHVCTDQYADTTNVLLERTISCANLKANLDTKTQKGRGSVQKLTIVPSFSEEENKETTRNLSEIFSDVLQGRNCSSPGAANLPNKRISTDFEGGRHEKRLKKF